MLHTKKSVFCVLMGILVLFVGCNRTLAKNAVLQKYYGTWYVNEHVALERSFNPDCSYHDHNIHKKLVIGESAIVFDGESYEIEEIEQLSCDDIIAYYCIYGRDALHICTGLWDELWDENGDLLAEIKSVKHFSIRGTDKIFGLFIAGDGSLLIQFREEFVEEWGFYSLSKTAVD